MKLFLILSTCVYLAVDIILQSVPDVFWVNQTNLCQILQIFCLHDNENALFTMFLN